MVDMNLEQARFNMIEQQIRPWNVMDEKVLELMGRVPREDFVPTAYRNVAFADVEIPIGHGELMPPPKLEAKALQALAIQGNESILEIGTGSGFTTALLANLAGQVLSVDIEEDFTNTAREKLARHNIHNVTLETGDASRGWAPGQRFDVVMLTGSLPKLQRNFEESLNVGGRLFAVLGSAPVMEATLITRISETEWRREPLFETDLAPLLNTEPVHHFDF